MTAINLTKNAGLVFGGLVVTGIAFGPASVSVLGSNFAAAGNGVGAIAQAAQTGAGWIAGAPVAAAA